MITRRLPPPEPQEEPEYEPEYIEGEYRAIPSYRERLQGIRERAGRLGRRFGTAGRYAGQAAGGFTGGVLEGLDIEAPSSREVGRLAGRGVRSGARALGRIGLREPGYWWGHKSRTIRRPYSRLPIGIQREIVNTVAISYPGIFNSIWYEDITLSEFVGTLRNEYPDIYEAIKSELW